MITCLIADDEPLAVQLLEDYIQQSGCLKLVYKCYDAMEAHRFLRQQKVDLLFLDINMPRLTGMELASLLPPGQAIVFTTAYSEYAVQSYEKNALDYLLKPISFERFMKAVTKAEAHFSSNTPAQTAISQTFIKSGKAIVNIDFDKVLFIEGLKDYVAFHTSGEKIVVYKRMKELEETLPLKFIRIHNSYFINAAHISRVEDKLVFVNGRQLPVSDKYREQFLQRIKAALL